MDRERCARLSSIVAVPTLLFLIDWLSQLYRSRGTEFLLVPPLAVIIYLIFSQPEASYVNLKSIVLIPVLGSAIGEVAYRYFGLTPWGVAVATLACCSCRSPCAAPCRPRWRLPCWPCFSRPKGLAIRSE